MKSLYQTATGKAKPKENVQNHPAKYWGTIRLNGKNTVVRSDGSVTTDKTAGVHSRPHKKEELRNVNRSINKTARKKLEKDMNQEVNDLLNQSDNP